MCAALQNFPSFRPNLKRTLGSRLFDSGFASPLPFDDAPDARLERLLERHAALLRTLIAQHCPRDLGIQLSDIEQEARVRLWKALQREKELNDPASYIYRIAVSATIDAVRRVLARREDQIAEFRVSPRRATAAKWSFSSTSSRTAGGPSREY